MRRFRDDSLKVKRYGQIFSGKLVGNLLVSMLPDNLIVRTIVDPMAGQGDLLKAAYAKYPLAENVTGIEIDADVIGICKKNIPEANIVNEDAFRSKCTGIEHGWDLVITNPPYVRYQTLKSNPEAGLPDGCDLRRNLIEHIRCSKILDLHEKQLYLEITKGYSGLSDMAVPSWILCASIVKRGGYMAIVVPETWLNRDYALPIHYLLLRCFEIIAVARDVESAWFDGAEVRTCLVICIRKENHSLKNSYAETVLLEINSEIMDSSSLVSRMHYGDRIGYEAVNQIIYTRAAFSGKGFSSRIVPAMELFPGLLSGLSKRKWVCKEDVSDIRDSEFLPNEMKALVSRFDKVEYDSLTGLGWSIGQGIRTGANDFFYAELIKEEGSMQRIRTGSWYGREIYLSVDNLRKALKKRADVRGLAVEYDDLRKCIIYIQNQVKREDLKRLSNRAASKYTLMDSDLDDYISEGEKYISPVHKRFFRELTAVITNEKRTDDGFERFWYMLPALKERHVPNLCISRVCGETPETMYVNQTAGKEIVVDANFITLWNVDPASRLKMFALLNSTWAKLFLELTCTVMGGGALKVEASHVRKIVFPRIDSERKKMLEGIGRIILREGSMNRQIQSQIDEIVISPFGKENGMLIKEQLEYLLARKFQERTGRRYGE